MVFSVKVPAFPILERGLFPNIFNLATNAIIKANATCGQEGPESYCKLVEHVFLRFVFQGSFQPESSRVEEFTLGFQAAAV